MFRGRSYSFWRKLAEARVFVLPGILLLAVTLPHFGQGDFRGDAGWYSAIGLQAWRTGSLWTLWAEPGQPYFNKPPLAFWIHGLVLHLAGPHLWAARLPSVAAALGCVLVTVAIARDLAGRRAAVLSGVVLALTLEFFRRTREISLDMWQAFFLLLGAWAVVRGVRTSRGRLIGLSGVAIGLALMVKPLVAFLFFPVAAAWLLWIGRARLLGWLALAFLVAAAVAAPWHLSMVDLHGAEFVSQYFGVEIAERATGQIRPGHESPPPVWFYFGKIAELYWPWLIAAALGFAAFAQGRLAPRHRSCARFAIVWLGLWILFLTIYPDRRDRYSILLYPALAMLAGLWLAWAPIAPLRRCERVALRAGGPLAVLLALVISILPIQLQRPPSPHWPELFAWMRDQGGGPPELWQGAAGGAQAARVYLEFGTWPHATRNRWGEIIATPPEGALLLYHDRAGLAPGPNETELFRARNGDLLVSRLSAGPWNPVPFADPGD